MKTKHYLTAQSPGVIVTQLNDYEPEYHVRDREDRGGPAWKLDVGKDCNLALTLAEEMEHIAASTGAESEAAKAIRYLVERVAEFEALETE